MKAALRNSDRCTDSSLAIFYISSVHPPSIYQSSIHLSIHPSINHPSTYPSSGKAIYPLYIHSHLSNIYALHLPIHSSSTIHDPPPIYPSSTYPSIYQSSIHPPLHLLIYPPNIYHYISSFTPTHPPILIDSSIHPYIPLQFTISSECHGKICTVKHVTSDFSWFPCNCYLQAKVLPQCNHCTDYISASFTSIFHDSSSALSWLT